MKIENSLILITGASSGIGESTARLLAKNKAKLILLARNEEKLTKIVDEIHAANGQANYYCIDLTEDEKVIQLAKRIIDIHGVPDIIINSAGAGRWLSLAETSTEEFASMVDSPLVATANTIKGFLKPMINRNSGQIITVNSVGAFFSFPGATGYLAARWGLRGFMESLYQDLYKSNISVSMLSAGKVDSPYFSTNEGSADRIPKAAHVLSRTSTVDEISNELFKLIKSPKKSVITPKSMALLVYVNRFFPRIFAMIMRKTSYKG